MHSYRNFRDAERLDLMWDLAPGRRAGALGDSVDVRVPLIPYTLHRQKAREGTCGGWGAELKTLGYSRVERRWRLGHRVDGGGEGLVNAVGITVGTRGR